MACAFCFAIQTYAQLVLYHHSISEALKKFFCYFIIIYPVVMISILIGLSARFNAVEPRRINCDVVYPIWIRLFSFSGINQLYSIPGTILSGRAAYEVYKHMDQLKKPSTNSTEQIITQNNIQEPKYSKDPFSKTSRSYNLTRAAAIKMVTFSFLFAFINLLSSISSFAAIIKGYPLVKEPYIMDFIGKSLGIFVFLVFGWPHNFEKAKQIWLNG
ncbi:3771_t:CDS:2 [Cetraspora pellucida]|uniref:3771_t:CDS:1 n=1 Tax=Cetraspora pellucida TaxID=1433469 RepID=A0A9N8W7U1_9GLOM|nr:3771_t:CDS:2 [Cetraspora pellucida]